MRQHDNPSYHPGRCAKVYAGGKLLGVLGQIHPLAAANYGVDDGATYCRRDRRRAAARSRCGAGLHAAAALPGRDARHRHRLRRHPGRQADRRASSPPEKNVLRGVRALRRLHRRRYPGREEERCLLADAPLRTTVRSPTITPRRAVARCSTRCARSGFGAVIR